VAEIGGTGFTVVISPNQTFRMPATAGNGNPAVIKSSAGSLFTVALRNTAAAERYIKFYDLNRAPVIGADIPMWTDFIPPSDSYVRNLSGLQFQNGIAMGLTTGAGDQDATFPAAGEIVAINISFA
jgi:hypothetical protein